MQERRRFRLHGPFTGADAASAAEAVHLKGRAALRLLTRTLDAEAIFWRDVAAIRSAREEVDRELPDAERWRIQPAWARTLAYGVRGERHRVLIATVLYAAGSVPNRHDAQRAMARLGERLVRLDGNASQAYGRNDVTRLLEGFHAVAAYRAGRCGVLNCPRPRRGRYCRAHGADKPAERARTETRKWALNQAADALRRPSDPLREGEYVAWLIRTPDELSGEPS